MPRHSCATGWQTSRGPAPSRSFPIGPRGHPFAGGDGVPWLVPRLVSPPWMYTRPPGRAKPLTSRLASPPVADQIFVIRLSMGTRVMSVRRLIFRILWAWLALLGAAAPVEAQQLRELFRRVSPAVVVVRTINRSLGPEP